MSARLSPETSASTGACVVTPRITIDFTIAPSSHPTAAAASGAVRVESVSRWMSPGVRVQAARLEPGARRGEEFQPRSRHRPYPHPAMWTVRPEPAEAPDVHALIREYFAELTVRYFRRPTDEAEIDLTLEEFPARRARRLPRPARRRRRRRPPRRLPDRRAHPLLRLPRVPPRRRRPRPPRRRRGLGPRRRPPAPLPRHPHRPRRGPRLLRLLRLQPKFPHEPTPRPSTRTTGSKSPSTDSRSAQSKARPVRPITKGVEARYVIFDLDDTLVHSDAVRKAFATVADAYGIDGDHLTRDAGRPSRAGPRARSSTRSASTRARRSRPPRASSRSSTSSTSTRRRSRTRTPTRRCGSSPPRARS